MNRKANNYLKKFINLYFSSSIIISLIVVFVYTFFSIYYESKYWIPIVILVFFLIHDAVFRFINVNWIDYGRDYITTLRGLRSAIQYTSILMAFVGVIFSQFLKQIVLFLKISIDNIYIKIYIIILLFIITFMLLFIPIIYKNYPSEKFNNEPSCALKNYFFIVLYFQKCIVILTIYLFLKLGTHRKISLI